MIGGARWLLLVAGVVVAILLVPPVWGGLGAVLGSPADDPALYGYDGGRVAGTTLLWAGMCGAVAVLIGWFPARWIAERPGGWMSIVAIVPLALPPSILFDAWWLEVGPRSLIGRWAAQGQWVSELRETVLALSLVSWGWPLAAFALALLASSGAGSERMLARLDGVGVVRRGWLAVGRERWGVLAAWLLTSAVLAGNTVNFDLAQVASWGFELRTLDARGAPAATVLRAGAGAIVMAIVVVLGLSLLLLRRRPTRAIAFGGRSAAVWLVPIVLTAIPITLLLVRAAMSLDLGRLWTVHGTAIANTAVLGLGCAVVGAILAGGACAAALSGGTAARVSLVALVGLGIFGIAPASLVAIAFEAAWNHSAFAGVYDSFWGLILGVGARVGIVAAGVGLLAGSLGRTPVLRLDAPRSTRDFVMAARPWLLRSAVSGAVLGGVLGMAEIAVVSRIQPPGVPLLASALLNAMHYQYVDTVLPAVFGLVLGAVVAAVLPARLLRRGLAPGVLVMVLTALVALPGCGAPTDAYEPAPVEATTNFGGPGTTPGRFDYPRALALDSARMEFVVIDKSARVQRFGLDGTFLSEWRMPQWENGKPTGVAIADDGRIYVADTHYHRIAVFNLEGSEQFAFGSYGESSGEFIYPTDVAFGPDGTLFVSEYGGNDRIQVFTADGGFLRSFGSMGDGDGKFSRPQAIAWDGRRGELFIADAINHRIVVTDANGSWKRVLGGAGRDPGRFSYPYDLTLLDDGSVMVVEFGNNRIQHIDAMSGECLGLWGGTGREEGRLRYPWGIDAGGGVLAVLDSGNSRVLVGETP